MAFSAGTVVLDVYPSFRGMQQAVGRQAQEIGRQYERGISQGLDNVEKNVEKSAERSSGAFARTFKKRIEAALKDIDARVDVEGPDRARLSAIRLEMEAYLKDIDAHIDIDAKTALAQVRRFAAEAEAVAGDVEVDVRVRNDALAARKNLAEIEGDLRRLTALSATDAAAVKRHNDQVVASYRRRAIEVSAALQAARLAERDATNRAMRTGSDSDVASANAAIQARYAAEREAAEATARVVVAREVAKGAAAKVNARDVDQAYSRMYGSINRDAAQSAATRIAMDNLAARVQERNARQARAAQGQSLFARFQSSTIGQAANSMRLFNGYLLTALTIGPLLIPILGAIAGGFGGVAVAAMAAVAGIGALVAGFSGISSMVQALAAVDKERRKQTAGSAAGNPDKDMRGLRDAQLALSRAREDAGRRIAAAAERQATAERSLTKAVQQAADAQRDLINARRRAAEDLEDQNNRLRSGLLDEQLGAYRLQEAGYRYNTVLEDDQATTREKEIARLEYEQAQQSYKELQTANRRLERDVAAANAAGVEGSEEVVRAKERILDADEQIRDAEVAVADAAADTARARVEEAREMADAERRVADAMLDLRNKSVDAGVAGSAAMDELRESMLGLTPAAQAFALYLYSLKPLLDDLRAAGQNGLLPGVQQMLEMLVSQYGPGLISFVGVMAKAMGDLAVVLGQALTSSGAQAFFGEMATLLPSLVPLLGRLAIAMGTILGGVLQAFAPYTEQILDFFVRGAEGAARWAVELGGSDGFASFMEYVRDAGPKVAELFGAVAGALLNLAIGLAPHADRLVDFAIGFFGWLSEQDPSTLATWALAIGAFATAFQILAGAIAFLAGGLNLVLPLLQLFGIGGGAAAGGAAAGGAAAAGAALGPAGWIALAIGAVLALAGAIWYLYETNETFRKGWDDFWNGLGRIVSQVINNVILPPVMWLWNNILAPFFRFIGEVFGIATNIITTFGGMIAQIFTYIIAPAFRALWDNTIKPWWEEHLKPVFDTLATIFDVAIVPAFQRGLDAIARVWQGMVEVAKVPVRFMVETVVNGGIIDTFNRLVEHFPGMTKVDHVRLPASWDSAPAAGGGGRGPMAFATGGVLPGYTPGRDVHRFVSPTGGVLDLSGGEGIARPEIVRALGPQRWNAANAAARRGDVGGALQYLGGYASGGILGMLRRGAGAATDVISGAAGNIAAFLRDPKEMFARLVSDLVGGSGANTGFAGLVASVPAVVVNAIADLLGGGATGGERSGPPASGAIGWKAMWDIVRSAWPGVRLTSGYRPGAITATGVPSMHGHGRAIDLAPPSMALFNWLNENYPNSQQILYSPAGPRQIVWNGRRGDTSGVTRAMHYNHVHWAMKDGGIMPTLYDKGGELPPGLSLIANATGKPEQVLTNDQWTQIVNPAGRGVTHEFNIEHMGADAREVAAELDVRRRDRMAMLGVSQTEVMIG